MQGGLLTVSQSPYLMKLSHHLILPGPRTTTDCNFFTVSHMITPVEKQDDLARAFEDYISTVSDDGKICFMAVAASREDPEVVVCLTGFREDSEAKIMTEVWF